MIAEQIGLLKATVNALSIRLVAMTVGVDNATAAHGLGDALSSWAGEVTEVTTETYVLVLEQGAEAAEELRSGTRLCKSCLSEGLDGYLHKEVL